MRILHCSDIHLGRQPYQLDARFDDYARMFLHLCERAAALEVDLFLIGGDLFDKRNINAATLAQATDALTTLKDAQIPVVAVEGNHDKAFRHDRQYSWMQYLARAGYVRLLNREYEDGQLALREWNPTTLRGAWVDIGETRVYGLGYPGVATESVMREAASLLPENPPRFTVLLLHAGVGSPETGSELGSVSWETLDAFAGRVHVVALGHWHRKIERRVGDPPIVVLMPGSPEICDIAEVSREHGFFLIETLSPGELPTVTFEPTPHRPHFRLRVDVNGCTTFDAVLERVGAADGWATLEALVEPVVEVTLIGHLPFDPLDIRSEDVRDAVLARHACLHVEVVNNANLPVSVNAGGDFLSGRDVLERGVLRELIAEGADYAPFAEMLVEYASQWMVRALEASDDVNEAAAELIEQALDAMDTNVTATHSAPNRTESVAMRLPGFESLDDEPA
jgi:DNA repair exonuclease SbcCD nuclease subunit